MRSFVFVSVICLKLAWSYGAPEGVGAYAYQDTNGNRYGGTYGLNNGQYFGQRVPEFAIPFSQNDYRNNFQSSFQDLDDFFPEYFRNFENLLQEISGRRYLSGWDPLPPLPILSSVRPLPPLSSLLPLQPFKPLEFRPLTPSGFNPIRAFHSNLENQKIALNAANKAFDLTSNQAGYIPNFARPPYNNFLGFNSFPSFPNFGNFDMSGFPNSAYAGGAVGPGFSHQIAGINPANPDMPNVNVMNRFADVQQTPGSNFVSMSSRAYSVSSNVNGKEFKDRGAETTVNNNGKVTTYRVKS